MFALLPAEGARRRRALAFGIYLLTTVVYFAFALPETLREHTNFNHFALEAEAWLRGRLDLVGPPPNHNDFASLDGKWFVPFPPLPAVVLLPFVALHGSADAVADGAVFLWLAGVAPVGLFLALEKLRARASSERTERESILLALLFAFGSVYFFSAEQGSVWFAAHVVGTGLGALYLWAALDAERPFVAGLLLGLAFAARSPLLFAAPLFVLELARTAVPSVFSARSLAAVSALERARFARGLAWFTLPVALVVLATLAYNAARFHDPFEVGYRYLTVAWAARIEKWGLFSYHYLARNLGVMLTSLPWLGPHAREFRVNGHGLALWVTTPAYLFLLWPRSTRAPHLALVLTALAVALPTLLYQNSGWVQFGYRFSNDYAVFLFALLYVGGRRFGALFYALAAWAVVLNAFGAWTFARPSCGDAYFVEGTQRVLYEPD